METALLSPARCSFSIIVGVHIEAAGFHYPGHHRHARKHIVTSLHRHVPEAVVGGEIAVITTLAQAGSP